MPLLGKVVAAGMVTFVVCFFLSLLGRWLVMTDEEGGEWWRENRLQFWLSLWIVPWLLSWGAVVVIGMIG